MNSPPPICLGARGRARWTAIGFLAAALFIVAAVNAVASQVLSARQHVDEQTLAARERESLRREIEAMQLQQKKLEALVNSIDGIVWEAEAESSRFTFLSRQSERILGFTRSSDSQNQAF